MEYRFADAVDETVEVEEQPVAYVPGRRTLTATLAPRLYRSIESAGHAAQLHGDYRQHVARALGRPGMPLPDSVRRRLELALLRDLSSIRLHTDAAAATAAASLGARAVTAGDQILFAEGAYAPGTDAGDRLLVHEVAHAALHRGEPGVAAPDEAAEREADDLVDDLMGTLRGPPPPGIARGADAGDRAVTAAALAREGLAAAPEHVDALARLYGPSMIWTRWLWAGGNRDGLSRLISHAEHHCGAACRDHEPDADVLDGDTRSAIAHTIGFDLGEVPIVRDPALAGRGGEAVGGVIRLDPELAKGERSREVRLHEAVHVAQSRLPGPVADREIVEAEAVEVAHAAGRGERLAPQLRADADSEYGFSLDLSPMGILRKLSPATAQFVEGGLDRILDKAGDAANTAFKGLLDGLGLGNFVAAFQSVTSAIGPGTLTFGVLTGCCECLDTALSKMDKALDRFLASDGAKKVQKAIGDAQAAEKDSFLDTLTDVFAFLKKVGGPVLGMIEKAAAAIAWVKQKAGALADKVWKFICGKLGLDASLPPLAAIKKRLGELWAKAAAALAPLTRAVRSAIKWLKTASPLAPLFKLAGDIKKLVAAVKKLIAAKTTNAKTWLATLAKELAGTVFEPLLKALETGKDTLNQAAAAVASWFKTVLDKLGLLKTWQSSVSFIRSIVRTVQGFVGRVQAGLAAVGTKVEKILKEVSKACVKVYGAIKPLLDFVVGFAMAAAATAGGNLLAFPMFFAGNLWLHVLPDCYKDAILNFCLRSFIKVVQWLPAKGMPIYGAVKAAVLGFLQSVLTTPRDKKIKAMNLIASFFAGNVELAAGLIVGVFKGLYESTIGTVVFIFEAAAWLGQMGVQVAAFSGQSISDILAGGGWEEFLGMAGESGEGADGADGGKGKGDKDADGETPSADEVKDEEKGGGKDEEKDEEEGEDDGPVGLDDDDLPDDTPDEDSDPEDGGDEEPVLEGGEDEAAAEPDVSGDDASDDHGDDATQSTGPESEPDDEADAGPDVEPEVEPDDGDDTIDPPPVMPADLASGRALFDAVFKEGVSREQLEELLTNFGTGLEKSAAAAGGKVAKALIATLAKDGAAYDIGEKVGIVVGMAAAEVIIAYFTAGIGLAKTAVTLTKVTLKLAKNLPELMKVLRAVVKVVKPILQALQKLKKGIGAWAGKIAKYIDDLIEWAMKTIKKIARKIKNRLKGKKPPKKKPKGKKTPKGKKKKPKKPKDKHKRDEGLRIAAKRGAMQGWQRMSGLDGAVHQISAVRAKLRGASVRRPRGVTVKLSIASRGSGWKVRAVASKKLRRATAKSGHGWISRAHKKRTRWYATRNDTKLHKDIIADALKSFEKDAKKKDAAENRYKLINRHIDEQREKGQGRIKLRGVTFQIKGDNWEGVEKDGAMDVDLVITPNATTAHAKYLLANNPYKAIRRSDGRIEGHFQHFVWGNYPPVNVTPHPVNAEYGHQNGTSVAQPTGKYVIGDGISHKDPSRQKWQAKINKLFWKYYDEEKTAKPTAGKQAWNLAAKARVEADYGGMPYQDVFLVDWDAHHIKPRDWGGKHNKTNFQYLKNGQHKELTKYWSGKKADVKKVVP